MKRLALAALLALGTCISLPAQQSSFLLSTPAAQPSAPASTFNFTLVPELTLPATSSNLFATPTPTAAALPNAPAPAPYNDQGYRWDLAVGYEYIHFDSSQFSANLSGLHTDLTYNLNPFFGLEGNVISAWGGEINGERTKYVLYAGGGRFNLGITRKRFTPWAHVLAGGVHLNPEVARGSKNGFALQAGGGADWTYNPRVSLRAEADYVYSRLYSDTQNNFQIGLGAVIHF